MLPSISLAVQQFPSLYPTKCLSKDFMARERLIHVIMSFTNLASSSAQSLSPSICSFCSWRAFFNSARAFASAAATCCLSRNIQIFLINTKINKYIEIGTYLIRKKLTKKNTPKNTLISRTERFFFHNFWFAILNLSSTILKESCNFILRKAE